MKGIFYQLKNGYNWQDLPKNFAPLLNRLLALQAVARCKSHKRIDERLKFSSP
ncbi:hypothetical protein AVDCRST_MAG92-1971 [uncultured Coleofasciculus sp.]|uniref:Uncharacterized protein n=1 Tax=uncultured Coleofasciculus sp. TaxID=1267456 RepID=A0A6J4IEL6_9CYAN|nr:hypothetical protein AVDCRST_MAG92-1971 [uncultured Coleofasciculus sp.]